MIDKKKDQINLVIRELIDTMHGGDVLTIIKGQKRRTESGPIQIGDDWPGYFFRGKHAFWYGNVLARHIELVYPNGCPEKDSKLDNGENLARVIEYNSLCALRDELLSCVTTKLREEGVKI